MKNVKNEQKNRRRGRPRVLTEDVRNSRKEWSSLFNALLKRTKGLTSRRISEEFTGYQDDRYPVTKIVVDKWRNPSSTVVPRSEEMIILADVLNRYNAFRDNEERERFLALLNYQFKHTDFVFRAVAHLLKQLSIGCGLEQRIQETIDSVPSESTPYVTACLLTQFARLILTTTAPQKVVVMRRYVSAWGPERYNSELDLLTSLGFMKYLHKLADMYPTCQFRTIVATDTEDTRQQFERDTQKVRNTIRKIGCKEGEQPRADLLCYSPGQVDSKLLNGPHKAVWLHFTDSGQRIQGWSMEELGFGAESRNKDITSEEPRLFTLAAPLSRSDCSYYRLALGSSSVIRHDGSQWEWG